MKELTDIIEEIVELCYQQKKIEAYEKINLFISMIAQIIVELPEDKVVEINAILQSILSSMETSDIVAVADLLEYELKEKLV